MEDKYLKKDLIKVFVLTAIFVAVLIGLLYWDNKNQILEKVVDKIL